jgi:hypothetical protein
MTGGTSSISLWYTCRACSTAYYEIGTGAGRLGNLIHLIPSWASSLYTLSLMRGGIGDSAVAWTVALWIMAFTCSSASHTPAQDHGVYSQEGTRVMHALGPL